MRRCSFIWTSICFGFLLFCCHYCFHDPLSRTPIFYIYFSFRLFVCAVMPNLILKPFECKGNTLLRLQKGKKIGKNAEEKKNTRRKTQIDSHKVRLNLVNSHKHAHRYHHHPQTFWSYQLNSRINLSTNNEWEKMLMTFTQHTLSFAFSFCFSVRFLLTICVRLAFV